MRRSSKLVSIVIPCCNAEPWVGEAIRSALVQTYAYKEVIVIDDGSTDGSLDIIKSFGDAIQWQTGTNEGGSAARNRGLALARGEFVQFLDADDQLLPSKIEREIAQLQKSGADVCVAPFEVVNTDGRISRSGVSGIPTGDPVEWLLWADIRLAPLYRRDIVTRAGGFDPSLPCCQDFDLNLRIALSQARYSYVDQTGYRQRRQIGSVSSDEIRLYWVMARVLRRVSQEWVPDGDGNDARRAAIAAKITSCARWLLRFGETPRGLETLRIAAGVHAAGWVRAYSKTAQCLVRILGPATAERFLWRLRRFRSGEFNTSPPLVNRS